ncbi:LON peptidase substrate-binding domain-containing protein [bacterium]|nr:LON peptidase substrate-binding domain-containing protein [bacterium]
MNIDSSHFELPGSFNGVIPIYPITDMVFFPKTLLPLRIFDARYKQMLADALAGDELIGIVLTLRHAGGRIDLSRIGTIGRIAVAEPQADGETNVVLAGIERFVTIGEPKERGYLSAHAKLFPEALPDPDDPVVFAQILRLVELIRESRLFELDDYHFPENDRALLFQYHSLINAFCSVSSTSLETKQKWLETASIAERYKQAVPALEGIITTGKILKSVEGKAPAPDKIKLN